MGLRFKLGLAVVIFISAYLALVGYLWLNGERSSMLAEMESRGTTLLRAFAIPCTTAMANNDTPTLDNYVDQFAEEAQLIDLRYIAVLDFKGRVVSHTQPGEFGKIYDDDFTKQSMRVSEPVSQLVEEPDAVLEVAVPVISGLRWGTLRAGFNLSRMELELHRRQSRAVWVALSVSLSAAAIAYLVLSFSVLRPMFRMRHMARRVGDGDLDARVFLPQKDEMGELAQQLNSMATQIQGYTGSLEKLVEERTAELAHANEKLTSANVQLERMARTDPLTGLFNRRHFMEQLQFEIRRGQRNSHRFAVVILDVDHFKNYNDTNGHPAGDALLQRLSALLEINLRATDLVARYGGEEFIILLLDTAPEEGYATAVKLQQAVDAQPMPFEESQPGGSLTISVGMAFYPEDATTGQELIDYADEALYLSKHRGRNRVSRYSEVTKDPSREPSA